MLHTWLPNLRDVVYMHCVILLRKSPHPISQKQVRLHCACGTSIYILHWMEVNIRACVCLDEVSISGHNMSSTCTCLVCTTIILCRKRDANNSCVVHCSPCIQAITPSVSHVATGLYTLAPLSISSLFLVSCVDACSAASVNSFCKWWRSVGGVTAPT